MKMLIAAAALGSIALPASAEDVAFEVRYDDLNMESVAGQETLDNRIEVAARKACGFHAPATGTRLRSREAETCVAQLKAKAYQQMASRGFGLQKGG